MNLNMLQSLVMGFISGLAEMLPISAEANRGLLRSLFGVNDEGALFTFTIHVATLLVLLLNCRQELSQLREAERLLKMPARRRTHQPRLSTVNTLRMLRSAAVVVVVCRLLGVPLSGLANRMWFVALALAVNGVLLFIPSVTRSGNKDSRNMPRADGLLMALGAGLSAIPGISAMGAGVSIGLIRGVDRRYALRFTKLLVLVGLVVNVAVDGVKLVMGGLAFGSTAVIAALAGGVLAAVGCWLGLKIITAVNNIGGFNNLCYYSWGLSLVCMSMYLFV